MADKELDLEDSFTMVRTATGPSAALEEAAKRVAAAMVCVAAKYVGRDQATDVFHDWWIHRFPGLCERYDGRVPFRTYAFDSLRRWCVEFRRRSNRDRLPGFTHEPLDVRQNPLDKAWQSDLRGKIGHALRHLPKAERRTVVLVKMKGLSPKQAAKRQGCSLGAVYTRICRGLERLHELLKDLAEFL